MNNFLISLLLFVLTLLSGCLKPSLRLDKKSDLKNQSINDSEMSVNDSLSKSKASPPVYILGGIQHDKMYSNFYNPLRIFVEGESAEHLVVSARGGRLDTIDKKKGLFQFYDNHSGSLIEIVVEDTISGLLLGKSFEVVPLPAPSAHVWKNMTPFRNKSSFNAKEFKLQNALVLIHDVISVPLLCGASSYLLIRIDSKGRRFAHLNVDKAGVFDTESKKIINAAEKDDIFIFKDIKSDCTPSQVKSIVYIIE